MATQSALQQMAALVGERLNQTLKAQQESVQQQPPVQADPAVILDDSLGRGGALGAGTQEDPTELLRRLDAGFEQALQNLPEHPAPQTLERILALLQRMGSIDPYRAKRKLDHLAETRPGVLAALQASVADPNPTQEPRPADAPKPLPATPTFTGMDAVTSYR